MDKNGLFCSVLAALFLFFAIDCSYATPPGLAIKHSGLYEEEPGTWALSELNLANPPIVELNHKAKLLSCTFMEKQCSGLKITLKPSSVNNLKLADAKLRLSYRFEGKVNEVVVSLLPSDFPQMGFEGKSKLGLPLIFSAAKFSKHCFLIVMSAKEDLIFFRRLNNQCHDFRQHNTKQGIYYSYHQTKSSHVGSGFIGPRVILNENFEIVKTLDFDFDHHEFSLLSLEHWIGIEIELDRLSNGVVYLNKRIREREKGKIVWDWGVSDFLQFNESEFVPNPLQSGNDFEIFYSLIHFNYFNLFDKNRMLVSLGNNGIVMLDKEEKKVLWKLGGSKDSFGLKIDQNPTFIHTPMFDDSTGSMYVFANENIEKQGISSSKILKYVLDIKSRKLKSFDVIRQGKEYVIFMGSLQRYGKILSLGMGTKSTGRYDFLEITESGEELWKMSFQNGPWLVYRIYRSAY